MQAAVEELARKDDLTLLFSAISSVCPQHNLIWRKVKRRYDDLSITSMISRWCSDVR